MRNTATTMPVVMDQQIAKGRVEVRHGAGPASQQNTCSACASILHLHAPGWTQVNIGALSRDDIMDLVLKLKDNTTKLKSLRLVCMPK